MLSLALFFFVIALFYASVGFGGGSSYIALLAVEGVPFALIPKISLLCNLAVVTGGTVLYFRRELIRWDLALPLVLSSVPLSILGGAYPIQERTFLILLSSSLFLAGLRLLLVKAVASEGNLARPPSSFTLAATGGALGLLSGMVGIGGGIFLSPVMLNLRWLRAKEAAAIASLFILLNSLGGLAGQLLKNGKMPDILPFLGLLVAVVLGGQIGTRLGTHRRVPHLVIQRATGALILFVSGRLYWKFLTGA